jgi:hypothetical protein
MVGCARRALRGGRAARRPQAAHLLRRRGEDRAAVKGEGRPSDLKCMLHQHTLARTIHRTPTNRTLARSLRHGEVRGGCSLHVLPPFAPLARWHSTTALEGRLTGGGMTESAWPSQPLRVSRDLSPRARAAGRAYWRRWCYYHAASSAEGEKKSVEDSDFKRLRERGLRCQSRSSAAAGQRLPGNPQAVIDRSIDSRIRLALQQPVLSAWLNSEKISCILAWEKLDWCVIAYSCKAQQINQRLYS